MEKAGRQKFNKVRKRNKAEAMESMERKKGE
jgi:hypothetical protein